jgi:hypothetical protein
MIGSGVSMKQVRDTQRNAKPSKGPNTLLVTVESFAKVSDKTPNYTASRKRD